MIRAAGSIVAIFFLYFFGLTRTGLIGPDEARYAAIGRAMAATGDWITPRLWGQPWFEKPALLYWMTAAGFKLGLGTDLAPRLPVALASVAFLIYFFIVLRREFGDRAAWFAAAILATSAGWLVYSHVAITDLPMSAAFAAAMLTIFTANVRASLVAGLLLGLAILAKGLVPLVLFIPALWFLRHRIRDLVILFSAALIVAAPWYALATLRNGTPFLEDFFWKHHFGRFLSTTLQHGQPIWFYIPILLAGIFPWIPLLALLFNRQLYRDRRTQFLLAWFAWGFVFFSASRNKLPGYLLPLLPPLAALAGIATAEARARSPKLMALLAASAALLCFIPALSNALPQALAAGFSRTPFHLATIWIVPALLIAILAAVLEKTDHRDCAVAAVAVLTVVSVVTIVWRIYPRIDYQLSGRSSHAESITCLPPMNRSQRYSIQYYAGRNLPDCK
ncbi:MAG TPA: glycosyltransferase family 39 protein [Bryobacteraceae bacterium]|jgi:4-amino-4-deoxy-L-arabinose transferase-like glycosyltransferase|nr:glycosyltransferase family 39 protein [Bryobacteraceae bacterium]